MDNNTETTDSPSSLPEINAEINADLKKENKKSSLPIPLITSVIIAAVTAVIMVIFFWNHEEGQLSGYEVAERLFLSQIGLNNPENHSSFFVTYTHNLGAIAGLLGIHLPHVEAAIDISILGQESLINIDLLIDGTPLQIQSAYTNGRLNLALPELTPYFLSEISTTGEQLALMEQLPQLLDNYFQMVTAITDVEANVELSGAGLANLTADTTRYTMTFTHDFITELLAPINEPPQWLLPNSSVDGDHVFATMQVWVSNGRIVGRDFELTDGNLAVTYRNLEDGNQLWYNLTVATPYSDDFVAHGLFNRSGAGFSGPLTIGTNQNPILIQVTNWQRTSDGLFSGTLNYMDTLEGVNVNLSAQLGQQSDNQTISLSGEVGFFGFNIDIGVLTIVISTDIVDQLTLPTFAPNYGLDNMADFVDTLPPEFIQTLEQFLLQMIGLL